MNFFSWRHRKDTSAFLTSAVQTGKSLGSVAVAWLVYVPNIWVIDDIDLSSGLCTILEHLKYRTSDAHQMLCSSIQFIERTLCPRGNEINWMNDSRLNLCLPRPHSTCLCVQGKFRGILSKMWSGSVWLLATCQQPCLKADHL